jgi:tetratricopeptide (TPR) repeat protein
MEFASLVAAFHAVFPHTSLWLVNAGHLLMIGSPHPLVFDVAELKRKMALRKVQDDLYVYMLSTPESLLAHFVTDERGLPDLVQNAPLNTDDKPIAEFSRVVSKMQIPQVVLGLIQTKRDPADHLLFDTEPPEEIARVQTRVRDYSRAEKYYLEGVFSNNFYGESLLALNMLTQANQLIPDDYRYHEEAAAINLAVARQMDLPDDQLLIHLDNAVEHLKVMLARYPQSAFDWTNLGLIYLNRGFLDKAEQAFTTALNVAPEYPLPRIYRASVFAGRGDAESAEAELLKALYYFPKEVEAFYRLALLYEFTDQSLKAISMFENLLDIDSDYRDASVRLARLKKAHDVR